MANISLSIITVTYGNRWNFLERNLEKLESISFINEIIIVNNGSVYDLEEKIASLKNTNIKLVDIGYNSGSANGFSEGISTFITNLSEKKNLNEQWVLLLDDDNIISKLDIDAFNKQLSNGEIAYFCNRLSRDVSNKGTLLYNSFLGFNCFPSKRVVGDNSLELLPYSGLLINAEALKLIGLPKKEYYLYCDDYDYSYRLIKNNIKTELIPSCEIEDLEVSWNKEVSDFVNSTLSGNPTKVYYSVRNRINFEKYNLVNNQFYFIANFLLFLLYIPYKILKNKMKFNKSSLKALYLGLKDGISGKLGIHKDYKLSA